MCPEKLESTVSIRERNAEAKKQAILEAALALFSARGFHGVAVPEVAVNAGVGTGTIYRYFDNKEALVNGVYRHAKNQLAACLVDGFDFNVSHRAQFHQFWVRLMSFAQKSPVVFRFLELQDHSPYLDGESRALELSVLAPIWAFCAKAKSDGVAREMPSEVLMAIIWGAFVGIVKAQEAGYIEMSKAAFSEAESACWDMFCHSK